MNNKFLQFQFRKKLGNIENKKEALNRLKNIKKINEEIQKISHIPLNKNSLNFKIYTDKKRERLINELEFKIKDINKKIDKLDNKLKNEYIEVKHINNKMIFDENNNVVQKKIENTREVEGKEKILRNKLDNYKHEKNKMVEMLNYLFNN